MKTQSSDTAPEVERILIEYYRSLSAAEKFKIVDDLTRETIALTLSGVRMRHPLAAEKELRLRAASRWLDKDLLCKAYGWDLEIEGY